MPSARRSRRCRPRAKPCAPSNRRTLLNAATAYVNVVRDKAVVRLRENDVDVLTEQLKATKDRFDVGEVTRTDVAQAEARRSEALATLAAAQANLKTSRAAYEQIIGHPPGDLVTPPSIRHLLPADLDDAMTLGDGENPIILAAVYNEEASLYAVQQIMGELLPEVTLEAQYQQRFGRRAGRSLEQQDTTSDGPRERAALSGRRRVGPRAPGQGDQQPAQEGGRGRAAQGPCRRDRQLGHPAVLRPRDQFGPGRPSPPTRSR